MMPFSLLFRLPPIALPDGARQAIVSGHIRLYPFDCLASVWFGQGPDEARALFRHPGNDAAFAALSPIFAIPSSSHSHPISEEALRSTSSAFTSSAPPLPQAAVEDLRARRKNTATAPITAAMPKMR
jgi:hypothetical protein